jgi:hypothetical protein
VSVALHRGMTFGYYARNGYYASEDARRQLDRMKALNIEWVCVVATVLQDTFASTRQYRDFLMTPPDPAAGQQPQTSLGVLSTTVLMDRPA